VSAETEGTLAETDQTRATRCYGMLGMLLPTVLMARAVELPGEQPTTATVPTFVASALGAEYGRGLFYITLFIGVLILFSTQLGIFEAMVRVTTDASHANSPRLRRLIEGDPRRFYFPFMFILLVAISIILHLALPVNLVQWSANMSNRGGVSDFLRLPVDLSTHPRSE
jgi:Ca2+/Na+ antiporter